MHYAIIPRWQPVQLSGLKPVVSVSAGQGLYNSFFFLQGEFNLQGRFPEVGDNVKLVQGLFNESLPPFIKSHYKTRHPVDITYLHIDCDLYAGKPCTLLKLLTQTCVDLLVELLAIVVIGMAYLLSAAAAA